MTIWYSWREFATRNKIDHQWYRTLDRAALGVETLQLRLKAAGEIPGPQPEASERALIAALREVRSVRGRSRRRVPCQRTRR
jgi:hypothetical protein